MRTLEDVRRDLEILFKQWDEEEDRELAEEPVEPTPEYDGAASLAIFKKMQADIGETLANWKD